MLRLSNGNKSYILHLPFSKKICSLWWPLSRKKCRDQIKTQWVRKIAFWYTLRIDLVTMERRGDLPPAKEALQHIYWGWEWKMASLSAPLVSVILYKSFKQQPWKSASLFSKALMRQNRINKKQDWIVPSVWKGDKKGERENL